MFSRFLLVLAERMNFPKAPVETVGLPFCSMGKSTLARLWDTNTKLSISHSAELLAQAAFQYCFRKCSSSAFQAVPHIRTDSCQEAFFKQQQAWHWDRRGRQLVLFIGDNLRLARYFLVGMERLTSTETGGRSFYADVLELALLSLCIFTCVHGAFFLHTGNSEYLWSSMLQPTLKHSQTRQLSLPISYFFSEISLIFCRVNFHFSVASAMPSLHGLLLR